MHEPTHDPTPTPPPADAPPAPGGISPALVLFLITGLIGLLIAVFMLLAEGPAAGQPDQAAAPRSRAIRDWQAPVFEVQTLAGDSVSLADFRGRTVFLNFWRTDCIPCVRELPAFQAFSAQQGDDGAIVLALNQGESPEQITTFLNEIGIDGILVLLDPTAGIRLDYDVGGYPTTFIIDADGMVRYRKLGEMTVEEMDLYLETLAEEQAGTS